MPAMQASRRWLASTSAPLGRCFGNYHRSRQPLGHHSFAITRTLSTHSNSDAGSGARKEQGHNPRDDNQGPRVANRWSSRTVVLTAVAAASLAWSVTRIQHSKDRSQGSTASEGGHKAPTSSKYASPAEVELALEEIRRELGGAKDILSTDADDLRVHGGIGWSQSKVTQLPVAVAYPRSTQQVSVIARVCNKHRVPLVAYAGGSSLEGNVSAPLGGLSVDFAFMDSIVQVNADDMDAVVQAGVAWQDLNNRLAKMGTGLFFPLDPSPTAKFGGMIGTNCSGPNAVRYGAMRDWVVNLTVVLADGTVVKTRRRPVKSSAGYNLAGLIVGAEGTLGLVTEATVRLAVAPSSVSVAVAPFPSIRAAADAAGRVRRAGIPVAAMEFLDEKAMEIVNQGGRTAPRVWRETPTLFFKFAAASAGAVQDQIRSVRVMAAECGALGFEFATDEREGEMLWSARKDIPLSMYAKVKDGEVLLGTDVAVPLSKLADLIEISKREVEATGVVASIIGHIGDGNFHEGILYNPANEEQAARVSACVTNMVKRAIEMEGTCTGEHGVGWGKKEALLMELGPEPVQLMRVIKTALDPNWIMNPGKIFDRGQGL